MTDRIAGVRRCALVGLLCATAGVLGCTALVQRTGIALFYRETPHAEELTYLDEPYVTGPDADPQKHRLDFYRPDPGSVPEGTRWPVLIFVHGGGWVYGDRAQTTGGADIYRNIGRFFASQGVGTAVISYRLQPEATWREQVEDVGRASRYVKDRVAHFGGDPEAIFLSGHSAGAHLAARFGLGPVATRKAGVHPCGLILVSGAAYDLSDEETYELGANRTYFEERFLEGSDDDWETSASVVHLVEEGSPPALIVWASGEPEKLKHQSQLLARAYSEAHARAWTAIVPGEDHERIVLTLSRDDRTAGPAMLDFIRGQTCAGPFGE